MTTAMTAQANTARQAYLQHLQSKSQPPPSDPSPGLMIFKSSSGGGSSSIASSSTNNSNLPVWKQRQMRNRELMQIQEKHQQRIRNKVGKPFSISFPSLASPPIATAAEKSRNWNNAEESKRTSDSAASPEYRDRKSTFLVQDSVSPNNSEPSKNEENSMVKGNENKSGVPKKLESNPNYQRFAFFQATSPKISQGSLSEKVGSCPLNLTLSSKDPSDDTQTTLLSSNASLEDDDERTPVTELNRKLSESSSAQEQNLLSEDSSAVISYLPMKVSLLLREEDDNDEKEDKLLSDMKDKQEAEPNKNQENYNGEEKGEDSMLQDTSQSPSGTPRAGVTAKWQELIRQKQDKYNRHDGTARLPNSSPSNASVERKTISKTPETADCSEPTQSPDSNRPEDFSTSFPESKTHYSPCISDGYIGEMQGDEQALETSQNPTAHNKYFASNWANQSIQPDTTETAQRFVVPFYMKEEEEKKESDQSVVLANHQVQQEETEFDDVVNALALSMGADAEDMSVTGIVARKMTISASEAFLFEMIHDCEERWKDSSKLSCDVRNSPLAYLAIAPSDSEQAKLLHLQQAEIAELRAKLTNHLVLERKKEAIARAALQPPDTPNSGPHGSSSNMSPVELIDSVPIEHIEVAVMDDQDVCSVTSGLTNLNDLVRGIGEETPSFGAFSSAPDPFNTKPRSPADRLGSKIVRRAPVELRAADGSNRKALYTGPVVDGQYTGLGHFEFEGTGDTYKGEVKNGKMHGQGTYTYGRRTRKNKNRPPKVLQGTFENNVFIG